MSCGKIIAALPLRIRRAPVEAFGFTNRILGPRSVCARLYVVRLH
jgi:hypothetical protein